MKKIFLTLILTILPLLASAENVEINGIYYNLVAKIKEAEVTRNPNRYSGSVEIPESVTKDGIEYKVTTIDDNAFYYCSGLTSVTIPNSVTTIGSYAFQNCSGLNSITIGNNVTSIRDGAFSYCNALTEVNISDIAAWCNIIWGNHASHPLNYSGHLFLNGEEIKELIIPNSVTYIRDYAFKNCSGLNSVTIGNNVTSLGGSAFAGCSGLTSVTIPNSVTSIGEYAFYGCNGLTSLTIGNSVTSIGEETFYGCSGLTTVTIGNSVTYIGDNAFAYCNSLTSVTIPNSVTSIGNGAFEFCSGLTSITIPSSVTSIGVSSFSYCSGLTSITISNSVTSIGNNAFEGCSGLTSVTIPNIVTYIGDYAFKNCGLTSVTIPNSVTYIGSQTFTNCDELIDVYCMAEILKDNSWWEEEGLYTAPSAFEGSYPQVMTLHVPAASIEAYRSIEPWSQFKTIVTIEDGDIPTPPEPPTPQKCATPEINFADGKVSFSCETEGVEYISEVTVVDAKKYYDSEFTLSQTYKITVYAIKTGYENSDVATREIVIENGQSSLFGDLNKDGKVDVADHVTLSNIIMNK